MRDLYNHESELAVLNIILTNPTEVYNVVNLRPFMFGSNVHSIIFECIEELEESSLVPEKNLIISYLDSKNKLATVGGAEYITYLCNLSYNKDNLQEFIRQVKNSYKARSLVSLTNEIQERIAPGDIDVTIASLKTTLDNLEDTSGGESTVDFKSASKDTWNAIVERTSHPGIRGFTSGFSEMDIHTTGINPGELWIVAGRPSMGKSAWACNSMLYGAKAGLGELMFSLEMRKTAITERILSIESGVSLTDIRSGTLTQEQLNKISSGISGIKDLPIYIDSNFDSDLGYIKTTIKKYVRHYDIKVVHLDYIQLLAERSAEQTAELGRISRTLKLLANDLGIGVIVYSQLNRSVELRQDKRPILSDLRQSGNLEEDADIVNFLYRDDYYNDKSPAKGTQENIIRKNRNGEIGTLFFQFEPQTNKVICK